MDDHLSPGSPRAGREPSDDAGHRLERAHHRGQRGDRRRAPGQLHGDANREDSGGSGRERQDGGGEMPEYQGHRPEILATARALRVTE